MDSMTYLPRVDYQPQGRWAERAEKDPIKTLLDADYFTPIKNSFVGDTELEPKNLDSLLLQVSDLHFRAWMFLTFTRRAQRCGVRD